jgi:hypothetical protein
MLLYQLTKSEISNSGAAGSPNDPKPASTTSGHPEITVWDMSPNNFSSIGPSTHPELGPPPVPVASRCLALAFLLTLALKSFKVWNNNQVI